jgi:hypothetical protein
VFHGVAQQLGGAAESKLVENARLVGAHSLHGKVQAHADLNFDMRKKTNFDPDPEFT